MAQSGLSGSGSSHSSSRDLPTSGGRAASVNYSVESSVAHATAGPGMSSASYAFEGSVAWTPASVSSPGPVVFGVVGGRGVKEGGTIETVVGLGFQAPGAGTTSVTFAGAPGTALSVLSDTELQVTAPAGLDGFGNTLGLVEVIVANALGSSTSEEAFAYTPMLARFDPARVGGSYKLHLLDAAGAFQALDYGLEIPGFAVPIPPLTGAFGLIALDLHVFGFKPATSDTTTWTLPVPPNPSLVGLTLQLQAASLTSLAPLGGSFTNIHHLNIIN